MLGKIKSVHARQVFDSRGNPTVECEIATKEGLFRAIVPRGASTGRHEALELIDGGKAFLGMGVTKAVENINSVISKKIVGMDACEQEKIDNTMIALDATKNKSNLGANAILAVSLATARAGAAAKKKPLYAYLGELAKNKKFVLPVPSCNIINGGAHAGNDLDIQEYMVQPVGAKTFLQAMEIVMEIYQTLKRILKERYGLNATNVGDEGGFAPPLSAVDEPIELILESIEECGYAKEMNIGLDCAASEFFNEQNKTYSIEGKDISGAELIDWYCNLKERYKIDAFEDPFAQDDWESYAQFNAKVGNDIMVIGDDLLATNVERIQTAINKKACNALLLKVNQIGTLTESIAAAKLSFKNNWKVMVSHRSGDTEDSFIADLAVGLGCGLIKTGAVCRSERTAKYNQLLRIEEELGKKAVYAGTL